MATYNGKGEKLYNTIVSEKGFESGDIVRIEDPEGFWKCPIYGTVRCYEVSETAGNPYTKIRIDFLDDKANKSGDYTLDINEFDEYQLSEIPLSVDMLQVLGFIFKGVSYVNHCGASSTYNISQYQLSEIELIELNIKEDNLENPIGFTNLIQYDKDENEIAKVVLSPVVTVNDLQHFFKMFKDKRFQPNWENLEKYLVLSARKGLTFDEDLTTSKGLTFE